jgi:hypothetical protein
VGWVEAAEDAVSAKGDEKVEGSSPNREESVDCQKRGDGC